MKKQILSSLLALTMVGGALAGCGGGGASSTAPAADSSAASTASAASTDASSESGDAAASGESKTIRVAWWGNQLRNEVTTKALDLYTQNNPNVKFETEFTDWSGYWDKMATQAAAGSMPDIMQQDYKYIKQYQKKGQLLDMNPYVESGVLNLDDCSESIIESGKIDGGNYALCLGVNAPALLYDIEVAQQAGVEMKNGMTVEEYVEAAKKVKEATGLGIDWGYGSQDVVIEFVLRGKGKVLFEDGKLGVDSADEITPFYQMIKDGIDGGYSASAEILSAAYGQGIEQSPLVLGKAWVSMAFSNQLAAYNNGAGKKFGIVSYPTAADDVQKAMYLKPSQFFSITSTTQNPEESAKVLDFFTNDVEANKILLGERGVPISSKVAEAIKPLVDENNQQVFDYVTDVEPLCSTINPPSPEGMGEVLKTLDSLMEQIYFGGMDAQQCAEKLYTDANAILAKAVA